jgi:acetyl-CoA carboxylase biotin carboxyl carrier protein
VTLTAKDVAEITKLLEESSFDELYLELDGVKLSLRRGGGGAAEPGESWRPEKSGDAPGAPPSGQAAGAQAGAAAPDAAAPASTGSGSRASDAGASGADTHDVPAPLLGTFYRAPKPGAPPFVEVGAQVEAQTIIGIIEVMKLMNTVRAGVRGRVTEILARDGALVEYGETLLRVGTTG